MGSSSARSLLPVFVGLFGFFTPFSIAGAHISLGIACLLLLLNGESRRWAAGLLRTHPLMRPVALWIVVSLVAVAFAEDPVRSAEKLKKLALLPLLPLCALPAVRRQLRLVLGAVIASTVIVAIWGLVDHLTQGGGLDARLRGIGGYYMTIAGILMIVGILASAELIAALKDPRPRRITFLAVSSVVIVGALLATYTRGSWLGFAAGLAVLLRKKVSVLVGLGIVALVMLMVGPQSGRDRVLSIGDADHPLTQERLFIWQHGLGMVKDRPWTGAGLVIPNELMGAEKETPHGTIRVHSHMHNAYLQIAVSMGIPALLVFLWMIFEFIRAGMRAPRGGIQNLWEQGLVAGYIPIVVALLVNGFFEWNFGDSEVLGLFYFMSGCVLGVGAGQTGAGDS